MKGIRKFKARGFTLIEIFVVLVVIAILAAIVAPQIAARLAQSNAQAHASELNALAACVRGVYNQRSDFATLTAATIAERCAQDNRRVAGAAGAGATMTNASGQTITFTIPAAAPFDNVVIASPGIPSAQCGAVLDAVAANFTAISGTAVGAAAATVVKAAGGQLNEANVPAACGNATTTTLSLTLNKG
jgi:prepilin-type N-terminal cleavage/methylation domain-containing protein